MLPKLITICKIALFVMVFMSVISHVVMSNSAPKKLQIGVKKRPSECPTKSKKGDLLHMHYTVSIFLFFLFFLLIITALLTYTFYKLNKNTIIVVTNGLFVCLLIEPSTEKVISNEIYDHNKISNSGLLVFREH